MGGWIQDSRVFTLEDSDPDIVNAFAFVYQEFTDACRAFGPFASPHEGYAIMLEEMDELWEEVKGNKVAGAHERQIEEAKQVAAMAIRYIVDIVKQGRAKIEHV